MDNLLSAFFSAQVGRLQARRRRAARAHRSE